MNRQSDAIIQAAVGKTITDLALKDNTLAICFNDGTGIELKDEGQSCCEHRYMDSDGDDFSHVRGAKLLGIEIREAPSLHQKEDSTDHDVEFLVIRTSEGECVFSNHNEHNGYYGGFYVVCTASS